MNTAGQSRFLMNVFPNISERLTIILMPQQFLRAATVTDPMMKTVLYLLLTVL